jgi:hypothetical protein
VVRPADICTHPESIEVIRTGEIRIGDEIHDLSEYASFVIWRGRILLTIDRTLIIYPVNLNPVWRAMALRFMLKCSSRMPANRRSSYPQTRRSSVAVRRGSGLIKAEWELRAT